MAGTELLFSRLGSTTASPPFKENQIILPRIVATDRFRRTPSLPVIRRRDHIHLHQRGELAIQQVVGCHSQHMIRRSVPDDRRRLQPRADWFME